MANTWELAFKTQTRDTVHYSDQSYFGHYERQADAREFGKYLAQKAYELNREWIRARDAARYRPVIDQLQEGLGEDWAVGIVDTGGGFTCIECRPVRHAVHDGPCGCTPDEATPYVWLDDQHGAMPQVGFYNGLDDGDNTMMGLWGYDKAGARFGDDENTDRMAIEGLLGSMRVLIEEFGQRVFKPTVPKPEDKPPAEVTSYTLVVDMAAEPGKMPSARDIALGIAEGLPDEWFESTDGDPFWITNIGPAT